MKGSQVLDKAWQVGLGFLGGVALMLVAAGCDEPAQPPAPPVDQGVAVAPVAPGAAEDLNKDRYSLSAPTEPIPAGESTSVTLGIQAADGLEINHEFPWSVRFESADGATLTKSEFSKDDLKLGSNLAEIPLTVALAEPGAHTLEAVGDFSVCNDTQCYVIRSQKLVFNLNAHASGDAPAAQVQ